MTGALVRLAILAALVVPALASAETRTCRDLPKVSYQGGNLTLTAGIPISLPRMESASALYLHALCATRPAAIWKLVDEGRGAVHKLPEDLAASLDFATPGLVRVDYLYVRGGGPKRPVVVVLLTNGHASRFFRAEKALQWGEKEARRLETAYNRLPYEVLRRGNSWLHDIALVDDKVAIKLDIQLLGLHFGELRLAEIGYAKASGFASPFGSMFLLNRAAVVDHIVTHELAHFLDFSLHGVNGLAYGSPFSKLFRENVRVLGVRVPFVFRETRAAAIAEATYCPMDRMACNTHASSMSSYGVSVRGPPSGYVSPYARCGTFAEPFAETVSIALGVTQQLRWAADAHELGTGEWPDDSIDCNSYQRTLLWTRAQSEEPGAEVLAEKAAFIRKVLSYSETEPMDADGDGVTWKLGDAEGTGDCDDTNPTIGSCVPGSCITVMDCVSNDSCQLPSCVDGMCKYELRDDDEDGFASAACGGQDCNDADATIGPGFTEICDGKDNDCNGSVDDNASDAGTWYRDADGDGYGAVSTAVVACDAPGSGWTRLSGDCEDNDPARHPGASEDCSATTDLNCDGRVGLADGDGDGFNACDDCDDTDPTSYPGATERCDGKDNDCNGKVDDQLAVGGSCTTPRPGICAPGTLQCVGGSMTCVAKSGPSKETCDGKDNDCNGLVDDKVKTRYARDRDGDGYGSKTEYIDACTKPEGYVTNTKDCFDRNSNVFPGQTAYFEHPRGTSSTDPQHPSYDYDCDGDQRLRWTTLKLDDCMFNACYVTNGWDQLAECGETRRWLTSCKGAVFVCGRTWEDRTQQCR